MKKATLGIFVFLLFTIFAIAQNGNSLYATMDAENASTFKALYPDAVQILKTENNQSAVYITKEVALQIHRNVKTHGPGYFFRESEEKAIDALVQIERRNSVLDFTITEDALVNECLDLVNGQNIENDILDLQDYYTRYYERPEAIDAVMEQKDKWDALIATSGRTDVHTRLYNHINSPMPSVILTMDGANNPDEFVIVGGHIDSINIIGGEEAPGADDNASGIASLNEMVRVLLVKNFVPNRTIEVMAFAAEEIGLVGSAEIAENYANNGVNVSAFIQFDMTGYQGSMDDIYLSTDSYISASLNSYLVDLMDHYNSSGTHTLVYDYTACGYPCSDHASWAANGYEVAFPNESEFNESNPYIHTPDDVYSVFGTPDHSAKFTKLGLEFLIEAAKPQTLSVNDFSENAIGVYVKDKNLNYQLNNKVSKVNEVAIYNVAGQKIISEKVNTEDGSIQLQQFAQGFYIAQFALENGHTLTKKFILN